MERLRGSHARFNRSIALAIFCAFNLVVLAPAFSQYSTKTWADNSGTFSVQAKLLKINAASVTLRKANRVIIDVPFSRLSKTDLDFVRGEIAKKNPNYVSPKFVNRQSEIKAAPVSKKLSELASLGPFPTSLDLQHLPVEQESFPHAPPSKDTINSKPPIQLGPSPNPEMNPNQLALTSRAPATDAATMPLDSSQQKDINTLVPNVIGETPTIAATDRQPSISTLDVLNPKSHPVVSNDSNTEVQPFAGGKFLPKENRFSLGADKRKDVIVLKSPTNSLRTLPNNFEGNQLRPTPNKNSSFADSPVTEPTQSNQFQPPTLPKADPEPLITSNDSPESNSFLPPARTPVAQADLQTNDDSTEFVSPTSATRPPSQFKFSPLRPKTNLATPNTTTDNQELQPPPNTEFNFDANKKEAANVFAAPPSFAPRMEYSPSDSNLKFEFSQHAVNRLPGSLQALTNKLVESEKQSGVYESLKLISDNWPNDSYPVLTNLVQQCVASTNPETRLLAIKTLAENDVPGSGPFIVKGIEDENFEVRRSTYSLIAKFDTRQLLPSLAKRLDSADRNQVATLIENIGPESEAYVLPFTLHESDDVKLTTCALLGKVGSSKSIANLQALATESKNSKIRMQASNAIKQIQTRANKLR